jgi:Holliday junction resolvase RusA-like endonuclease
LWRAAEDALTGIVWADDAQITDQRVQKCYSTMPGVSITVEEVSA